MVHCPGSRRSGPKSFKTRNQRSRSSKHFLSGSQEPSTLATQAWLERNQFFHCRAQDLTGRKVSSIQEKFRPQKTKPNPAFLKMQSLKINPVTLCYDGYHGDKEFVLACKGRPFSVLTAPNYPTPPATMIDFNLMRDLKLKMTDLQCVKLH